MFFGTMTIDINGFSMVFLVLQPLCWLTSMVFKYFNNFFGTIDINCFSMVFKSFNHWFHRFSMVRDQWSNDDHKCSPFDFRFITITRSLGDLRALSSSWSGGPSGLLTLSIFFESVAFFWKWGRFLFLFVLVFFINYFFLVLNQNLLTPADLWYHAWFPRYRHVTFFCDEE